jgi:hypothetical protein
MIAMTTNSSIRVNPNGIGDREFSLIIQKSSGNEGNLAVDL